MEENCNTRDKNVLGESNNQISVERRNTGDWKEWEPRRGGMRVTANAPTCAVTAWQQENL